MKKLIGIDGSNSQNSINRKLLEYALSLIEGQRTDKVSLLHLHIPIYSEKEEETTGVPVAIQELYDKLLEADGFLIASPEHNSLVPAYFKNILDWLSRINFLFFRDKPVLLLSTSEGKNGGASNLKILSEVMPYWGANVLAHYSLPKFSENFDISEAVISNAGERSRLNRCIRTLEQTLVAQLASK